MVVALLLLACTGKDAADVELEGDSCEDGFERAEDGNCYPVDGDGDGWTSRDGDCNDGDNAIHPDADEVWYDGVDSDCDGGSDYDADGDGSDIADSGGDCDDEDAASYPGAEEVCDDVDNDCDGEVYIPTWYRDFDGDGYGDPEERWAVVACEAPDGYVADNTDCDDGEWDSYPGNPEVCDQIDNDCDYVIDNGLPTASYYLDEDGDGYGYGDVAHIGCDGGEGYSADSTDCDDTDADVNPDAAEIPDNGVDEDCDGTDG